MRNSKIALITGAGRGIGQTVAFVFAKAGYSTILVSKTKKQLSKTKSLIEKGDYKKSTILPLDVSSWNEAKRKTSSIKKLDVLINAAGIQGPIGKLQETNKNSWIKTINTNLIGTENMIRTLVGKIKKGGAIINFSGGGALTPRENFSSYAASKAAIVRLTETLAQELKSKEVRVNAVSPGGINTKMLEEMFSAGKKKVGEKEWKIITKQKEGGGENPIKVAKLCLFLVSEKSTPLTGKTISAVYDNWNKWSKKTIREINTSDWYTLRRLDPYTINKLKKLKI